MTTAAQKGGARVGRHNLFGSFRIDGAVVLSCLVIEIMKSGIENFSRRDAQFYVC
jgi:hypothetical protein